MRLLVTVLCLLPLCAQPPQEAAPQAGGRGAGEARNLKVLKPDEVMPAMRTFTAGLGVHCDFCHVGDRASDEKGMKVVARNMVTMVQQINTHFNGNPKVTCYTCHRGESEPKNAPQPAAAPAPPPGF